MIKYALKCGNGHEYEGWFGSSADYDVQQADGKLLCAVCGTGDIGKALMAPRVSTPGKSGGEPVESALHEPDETLSVSGPEAEKMRDALRKMKTEVEQNCDWVGESFADEVRAMHYGEKDKRGIYGKASPKEAKELRDEGVEVAPLPFIADPDDVN